MSKVKTGPKVLLAVAIIGGGLYTAKWYKQTHGTVTESVKLAHTEVTEFKDTEKTDGKDAVAIPGIQPMVFAKPTPQVRIRTIPWMAQMGLNFANGGPTTTAGSLMAKYGVNLKIEREDDYGNMKKDLSACAIEIQEGKKICKTGANFVTIMGDGGPMFLTGLNEQLSKSYGPDYVAEVVGSFGRSDGEDKFMGPPACKDDASKCRGLLVSGVLLDGDWNIAIFWAAENEICNNPDVKTYDPKCLNWVGTSSFADADEKYIQGACEDRPVVSNGKKTGETTKVCVGGVVTWTPGDVAVAMNKGGLASIRSTKENSGQMPNAVIGIRKWNRENRDIVKAMLRAALEGGDAVKRSATALKKAAVITDRIYDDKEIRAMGGWEQLYQGKTTEDKQGLPITLGGSKVFNLADNLRLFGLEPGFPSSFDSTYTTFGNYGKANYPKDLPSFLPYKSVVDTSYVSELAAETGANKGTPEIVAYNAPTGTTETLGKRSWSINFVTGSAKIAGSAEPTLTSLLHELVVAGNTLVEVHGYTDNVGRPESNLVLSKERAGSVKDWLQSQAPSSFPDTRVFSAGHGQDNPVADNDSSIGKAKNRRVEIVLKSN